MKRIIAIFSILAIIVVSGSLTSCEKENEPLKDFIADEGTFSDFSLWPIKVTLQGKDPSLGEVHGFNNANTARRIFIKNEAKRVDDLFPIGTLIVKHTHNDSTGLDLRTAMVKRGKDYDAKHGNWEYFIIDPNGAIGKDSLETKLRGNFEFKSCYSCHKTAKSNDYIFTD